MKGKSKIPLFSYLAIHHIENINNGNMTALLKVVRKIITHNVMVFFFLNSIKRILHIPTTHDIHSNLLKNIALIIYNSQVGTYTMYPPHSYLENAHKQRV